MAGHSKLVVLSYKNFEGNRTNAHLIPTLINISTKKQSEITKNYFKNKYKKKRFLLKMHQT